MKKAEQLRLETNKLEEKIRLAVEEFIREVGDCSLTIDTEMIFVQSTVGKKQLVSSGVKVNVTV